MGGGVGVWEGGDAAAAAEDDERGGEERAPARASLASVSNAQLPMHPSVHYLWTSTKARTQRGAPGRSPEGGFSAHFSVQNALLGPK